MGVVRTRKHYNGRGLSLVEMIMSMWLVGIVVFSTMVCTSELGVKVDQRRIQALNIVKTEMDHLRYKAQNGYLLLNGATPYTNGVRNYSEIIMLTDRRIVSYDRTKNTIKPMLDSSSPQFAQYTLPPVLFDSFDSISAKDYTNTEITNLPKIKNGDLLNQLKDAAKNGGKDLKQDVVDCYCAFSNIDDKTPGTDYDKKKNDLLPFILDVQVQQIKDTSNPGNLPVYAYHIQTNIGWFEKKNGAWTLTYDEYFSDVYSSVLPTYQTDVH